jgi:hypothetical protein
MKDIIVLISGLAGFALLYHFLSEKKIKENFGNIPSQTYKRIPEVKIVNKYQADVFSVPPTYQGNLPPRFSNTGYGAYILYNVPDEENLAVPKYPLTYGGNVKEPFSQDAVFQVGNDVQIPGGEQIYNYDRLVYAQKRSRLHGLGDPIRGDLPIVPVKGDWFRVSAYPNIDLRQGAVTTIAGHDNATAKELRALQSEFSGKTALAQKDISFDGRQADIYVTAFP